MTGGLAAPLVAVGAGAILGSSAAITLGTTIGIYTIGSLFGAAGAGLTSYHVHNHYKDLELFAFMDLESDGVQNSSEHDEAKPEDHSAAMAVNICVSGWVRQKLVWEDGETVEDEDAAEDQTQKKKPKAKKKKSLERGFYAPREDYCAPFVGLDADKENVTLVWEPTLLYQLTTAMERFVKQEAVGMVVNQVLAHTVLAAIIAAATWPLALIKVLCCDTSSRNIGSAGW